MGGGENTRLHRENTSLSLILVGVRSSRLCNCYFFLLSYLPLNLFFLVFLLTILHHFYMYIKMMEERNLGFFVKKNEIFSSKKLAPLSLLPLPLLVHGARPRGKEREGVLPPLCFFLLFYVIK